jgi:hypothetical protein
MLLELAAFPVSKEFSAVVAVPVVWPFLVLTIAYLLLLMDHPVTILPVLPTCNAPQYLQR